MFNFSTEDFLRYSSWGYHWLDWTTRFQLKIISAQRFFLQRYWNTGCLLRGLFFNEIWKWKYISYFYWEFWSVKLLYKMKHFMTIYVPTTHVAKRFTEQLLKTRRFTEQLLGTGNRTVWKLSDWNISRWQSCNFWYNGGPIQVPPRTPQYRIVIIFEGFQVAPLVGFSDG